MLGVTVQLLLLDCHSTQPRFGAPFAHDCTVAIRPSPLKVRAPAATSGPSVPSAAALASTSSRCSAGARGQQASSDTLRAQSTSMRCRLARAVGLPSPPWPTVSVRR